MKRLFVACFMIGALAGILQSACEAGVWEATDTTDLALADGSFWRLVDCDGDGRLDLLTIGAGGVGCRLQRAGSWSEAIPHRIDSSFTTFDVADSFEQGRRAAVLLVARDSLVVLGRHGDAWMRLYGGEVDMPYARGGGVPARFPFAVPGEDRTRAFAIPAVDSVLVIGPGTRSSVRRTATTTIRGRRASSEAPGVRLAHWNSDGRLDLILVEPARVVVHAGRETGFARDPTDVVLFREKTAATGGRPPRATRDEIELVPADLDRDGLVDLLVTGAPRDPLESWFSIATHGNRGDGCRSLADDVILIDAWGRLQPVRDRNGDGLADLRVQTAETGIGSLVRAITTNRTPVSSRLYTASAGGSFVHASGGDLTVRASLDRENRAPVLFDDGMDWNRDDIPDMLVIADGEGVLHQTAAGGPETMRETVRWKLPGLRQADYAITDIDGDGVVDFATVRDGPPSGAGVPGGDEGSRRYLRIVYGAVR